MADWRQQTRNGLRRSLQTKRSRHVDNTDWNPPIAMIQFRACTICPLTMKSSCLAAVLDDVALCGICDACHADVAQSLYDSRYEMNQQDQISFASGARGNRTWLRSEMTARQDFLRGEYDVRRDTTRTFLKLNNVKRGRRRLNLAATKIRCASTTSKHLC